jgi:hypothetical protein
MVVFWVVPRSLVVIYHDCMHNNPENHSLNLSDAFPKLFNDLSSLVLNFTLYYISWKVQENNQEKLELDGLNQCLYMLIPLIY